MIKAKIIILFLEIGVFISLHFKELEIALYLMLALMIFFMTTIFNLIDEVNNDR